MINRIFIHGLDSSSKGTKGVFFREKYPDMMIPTFTGDLQKRMIKLNGILSGKSDIRIVGSSFGGLMATLFALENSSQVKRAILLAPAINMIKFASHKKGRVSAPVRIYHGRGDDVIPLAEIDPIAREIFTDLSFNIVDDDHFLHKTFKDLDWDTLLA
ncbi:MAG: dienelactone hydrolase family protein [Proteobacteria bacterium]|nr:dienelactone hydrolase family protein [Pseudomonadota bacterium]